MMNTERAISPVGTINFILGLPELQALVLFLVGVGVIVTYCVKVQFSLLSIPLFAVICILTRKIGRGHMTETLIGLNKTLFADSPDGTNSKTVAIVTGASSGIGLETAIQLLRQNVFVILAVRNVPKMKEVISTALIDTGILSADMDKHLMILELNLDSLVSVKKFVESYKHCGFPEKSLAFLVNNAGAMVSSPQLIKDASKEFPVDHAFASNHLGHFLLTHLLFPTIVQSGTRVVSLSSAMHLSFTSNRAIQDTNTTDSKKWSAPDAYAGGKIATIWFIRGLQKRFDDYYNSDQYINVKKTSSAPEKASAYAIAPGTVWTPFHMPYYREFMGGILIWFPIVMGLPSYFAFKSTYEGSQTTLHMLFAGNSRIGTHQSALATQTLKENPAAMPSPGQMHAECRLGYMSASAADTVKSEKFWEYSLKLVDHIINEKL